MGIAIVIEVHHLSYQYPSTTRPALTDVNLEIPQGQFCGIVGPNRSGKSTLCYVLTGFAHHFFHGDLNGTVLVDGKDVGSTPLEELVTFVGLVLDNPFNQITGARFTVREEIAFGLENLGIQREEMNDRIDQAMEQVGISELGERSPISLSGGEQQRLAIASILAMRPKLIVLDEPTAQLDPLGSRTVLDVLASLSDDLGTTILLVEHKLEWLARYADRIILLNKGSIEADGSPQAVLGSSATAMTGTRQTQYSRVARKGIEMGLIPKGEQIPVTLEDAIEFFDEDPR